VVNEFLLYERADFANLLIALTGLALIEIGDSASLRFSVREWLSLRPAVVRWSAYYVFIVVILLCGKFDGPPFIYFQF
jgi:hypothetical protein